MLIILLTKQYAFPKKKKKKNSATPCFRSRALVGYTLFPTEHATLLHRRGERTSKDIEESKRDTCYFFLPVKSRALYPRLSPYLTQPSLPRRLRSRLASSTPESRPGKIKQKKKLLSLTSPIFAPFLSLFACSQTPPNSHRHLNSTISPRPVS